MRFSLVISTLLAVMAASGDTFYNLAIFAPDNLALDGKVINAVDGRFVIGSLGPTTDCQLADKAGCPAGNLTLVNEDMSNLASAVPGGQFIYITPGGLISYSSAHSTRRPSGSDTGGFSAFQVVTPCGPGHPLSVFTWESMDKKTGLWACQENPETPISKKAVLKASTKGFGGASCVSVSALQVHGMGEEFGAWEYTA